MRAWPVLIAVSLLGAASARAEEEGPGVYGELDGVWTLGIAGGGGVVGGATGGPAASVTGQFDLFVLSSVGLKVSYLSYAKTLADGLDQRQQSVLVDLDFRPLFLFLFLTDRFTGNSRLDLFLYSIGLEVGFSYERSALRGPGEEMIGTGTGFHVGTGFEVPLYRRGGQGLFLRFQVRVNLASDVRLSAPLAVFAGRENVALDVVQASMLLRWRFQFGSSL